MRFDENKIMTLSYSLKQFLFVSKVLPGVKASLINGLFFRIFYKGARGAGTPYKLIKE